MSTNNTEETIAGLKVVISKPEGVAKGVTILLPGSFSPLHRYPTIKNYGKIRQALNKQGQIVIGLDKIKVVFTCITHDQYADKVKEIHEQYRQTNTGLPEKYNIVGHSVGGKIALLTAVKDKGHVKTVISLDPIDENPVEFTKAHGDNLTLQSAAQAIYISYCGSSRSILGPLKKDHSASAIFEKDKTYIGKSHYLVQEKASHFCYTDSGTGPLIWGGTSQDNKAARDRALELIADKI